MATTPTNKPIPSEDPRDLKFNAGKIDEVVNSDAHYYTDRFGVRRFTIAGFQDTAEEAIRNYGYITMDSFEDGATLTLPNQVLRYEETGEYYRWDGEFPKIVSSGSTPEASGGIGLGAWLSVGDASLRSDLKSSSPGNGIELIYNGAKESELNTIKTNVTDGIVYLRDYESLVTDGDDWTNAINAALDTGKDVRGADGATYKVSGILKSKGQKLLGNWFINPTHVTHITPVKAGVQYCHQNKIRLIYMEVHYDLCEMLVIKSLGFNTIAHYTNFTHQDGAGGSIGQMLNNAATAGLRVQIDVDQGMQHNNLTLPELITLCDSYPATWGYSVYDEPATRLISITDQENRISAMRELTGKTLTAVDLIVSGNPPFYQRISQNYDYIFVDSYAQQYNSGTEQDKRDWDMEKSRLDVGGMMALTRCQNILYVGGLFTDPGSAQYTQDVQQGVDHVNNFLFKSGGEYGIFIWDAPTMPTGSNNVSNNTTYQEACLKLSQQSFKEKPYIKAYLFGSAPSYADFGLGDLMRNLPVKDPDSIQSIPWSDSYPADTGTSISGIGFKAASANFATTIPCRKYVSVYLDAVSATGSVPSAATLQLKGWNGEFTRPITPDFPIGTAPTFYGSSKWDGKTMNEQLVVSVSNGITDTTYRLFIRGLIVCTDW